MTGQKNAIVIPNIINPRLFTYLPKPEPERSELIFMCVSSWRAPKRLDLIFDALCSYAAETDRQIVLRVVGNGPQADDLKKRITPENLHIEWLGYLDRSEIVELLHKANIFVHPSEIETFSIVTAEALSTGTPVIASGTGALPELINKDNGILTDNNPGSWLNAIKEIVNKQFDHQAIAVENQNKFSPETIGKRIVSVYDKFLFNSLK